jgi:hypothetical protein
VGRPARTRAPLERLPTRLASAHVKILDIKILEIKKVDGDTLRMSVKRPTTPPGLGTDGRRLWRDINTGYELAPHELAVLAEACRVTDRLAGIATALADAP